MGGLGADVSMKASDLGDRGLRSPRHLGMIYGQPFGRLHPFMVAPVRPGETLVGASLQGDTWLNSVINAVQAPMMWAEVGLWYIPLPAMGDWMTRMITATGDDVEDATSGTFSTPGSIAFADNPNEPGLQRGNRPWAGETGHGAGTDLGAAYMPYASRGTYKVGEDWYGVNNYAGVHSDSRYNNAPDVDNGVSSASRKRADLQGFADPNPSTSSSFASMLEELSLLTKGEFTYAEYLAAHGVNPRHSGSISQPLMIQNGYLQAKNPEFVAGFASSGVNNANDQDAIEETVGGGQAGTTSTSLTNAGFVYGLRPMSSFCTVYNTFRQSSMFFDAPGIILGTVAPFIEKAGQTDGGSYFDAVRMINGGHWGDRSFGGVEETDFLHVADYYPRDGVQDDQSIWNFLNTYINGDNFSYSPIAAGNPFAFRDPTGRGMVEDDDVTGVTSHLSAQLHILSDLVG